MWRGLLCGRLSPASSALREIGAAPGFDPIGRKLSRNLRAGVLKGKATVPAKNQGRTPSGPRPDFICVPATARLLAGVRLGRWRLAGGIARSPGCAANISLVALARPSCLRLVHHAAGAGRDQAADDDVLLQAFQRVDLAGDGRLGQDAGGLLEGRRRDERLRVCRLTPW